MTINSKFLLVLSMSICVTMTVTAQTQTEYYRTYDDFLKKLSTPLTELRQPPFVRVISQGNRTRELLKIDSLGHAVEKHYYSYDKNDNLASVAIRSGQDRLLTFINYQPDSVQERLISKISVDRWIPENEACYTETYFDSLGNPIEQRVYAYNGYLIGIITQDYDQSGHLFRESLYRGDSAQLIEYTEFEFLWPDSIQTVRQYNGDGKLKSSVSLKLYK